MIGERLGKSGIERHRKGDGRKCTEYETLNCILVCAV